MLLGSPELKDVTDGCIRTVSPVSDADLYDAIIRTTDQELPIDEMRMNRRVFDAIRRRLRDTIPEEVYSLPDLMIWLSSHFSSDECKCADPVILTVLEREGMLTWRDEFRANTRMMIAIFELAEDAAERPADYQMLPEIDALVADFDDIAG
jgi:hypothetical protein